MRRYVACVILALCCGCGSDLLSPVTTCAGNWIGTQNGYNLGLQMVQTAGDTTVTGIVRITGVFGFVEGTIAGGCPYPNVHLSFHVEGSEDIAYTGTMSATAATINAQMNGSGFKNLEIDVNKK